ncbi:MAG: hypothetical protein C0497_10060 [Gemmatimonas sp.]|nr:hypothetical protein [Gemmatimonas sp.]
MRHTDEPASRTIVGRAYYSSYITVRLALAAAQRIDAETIGHDDLIRRLLRLSDMNARGIGGMLATLKASRVDADYKMGRRITHADAENALELAQDILTDLPTARLT